MRLQEMLGITTLGECADLSEGYYLVAYKLLSKDGNLGHTRIDVLHVSSNGIAILGGVFLFDRNSESPVSEIYKII